MMPELLNDIVIYYKSLSTALTWNVILQIATISLVSWIVYSCFLKVYFSPLRYLPAVPYVPIVGSIPAIMKLESGEYFEKWRHKLNASVYRFFWVYGNEKVCVADADVIKAITVTKSKIYGKPSEEYRLLKDFLGEGLLTSENLVHQRSRKLCNGSFKLSLLIDMLPVFEKCGRELMNMWLEEMKTSKGDNQGFIEIAIHDEMANFTFDVIGKCAFDYDFNAIRHDSSERAELFKKLVSGFQLSWQRILPELFPILRIIKTPAMKQRDNDVKSVDKIVYSVIKNKRDALMNVSKTGGKGDNACKTGKSLLTTLMQAKDADTGMLMDDKQLRDQVITFMFAGHETTAVSLTWCLLQIARYPEIQAKVRKEILSIIRSDDEEITNDHLDQLTYMTCFINETMRLYPPVMWVAREAREDNWIDNYFFPKGTKISINIALLHRNPKYWDNPLEYNPDRFEDPDKIYPNSFIPFLAGNRMCIGYKFALMEMKCVLALLIRKFEFIPIAGIEYKIKATITSRPDPRLYLKIREVKRMKKNT